MDDYEFVLGFDVFGTLEQRDRARNSLKIAEKKAGEASTPSPVLYDPII